MTTNSTIQLFKNDLWKDQRKLSISENRSLIKKHYSSEEEISTELSVVGYLHEHNIAGIPPMNRQGNELVTSMPYYKGIRIFNLLVELDSLSVNKRDDIERIKCALISRCNEQQKSIQKELIGWHSTLAQHITYPQDKILSIVKILSDCLDIQIDADKMKNEIDEINEYWKTVAAVPFRDATAKNMLLNNDSLHLSNYSSEEDRCHYLSESIQNSDYPDWLDSPIINFDFSSCIHDTTPEDDVISLKYHERTWPGRIPSADKLLWFGEPNGKRAAITFLVRYFRLGGRKAAYRLLHPSGYRIRFKHDNDAFYFERLPSIMMSLWPQCVDEFPLLMDFIKMVSWHLKFANNEIDLFLAAGYGNNRKDYYTDIFDPEV